MKPVPVSLVDLVSDVVEGLQGMAQRKSLSLTSHAPEDLPMIHGDRDKLHQVLTNLIQNAIKFTPEGGAIRVESRFDVEEQVRTCIADTGCGIPAHDRAKVFDRFYRGDSATSDSPGAGLGLAITKSLVELHGGRIWVENEPDTGSRFFFTLPIEPGERDRQHCHD